MPDHILNIVLHFVFEEETSEVVPVDATRLPLEHLVQVRSGLVTGEVVGDAHELYQAALGARCLLPAKVDGIITVWEGR